MHLGLIVQASAFSDLERFPQPQGAQGAEVGRGVSLVIL